MTDPTARSGRRPRGSSRRHVLGAALALGATALGQVLPARKVSARAGTVRPPGALPEEQFLRRCTRCMLCAEVCENACIVPQGFEEGIVGALTPVIRPRARGCTACMKCTQVCPTGALQPIERDEEAILGRVRMGVARLNKDLCYSYAKPAPRTCGVCYRACPFPGRAMRIGLYEQPTVDPEACIGCGLCEQACVHLPQAIRVVRVS